MVCHAGGCRPVYAVRDLVFQTPGSWWVLACPACGHHRLHPVPAPAALDALYRDLYTPEVLRTMEQVDRTPFEKGLRRRRIRAIRRALGGTEPRRVLDVGCGLGGFCGALARAFPRARITGLEMAGPAAARARDRGVEVVEDRFPTARLPERAFDVVSLVHVLEHQPHPGRALEAAHRLLRPGGLLYVEVPRADGWSRPAFRQWYWNHLPPQHLHLCSTCSLCTLLRASGFRIGTVETRAGYPFQASTAWTLFLRFRVGSRSAHARRPQVRVPAMVAGTGLLPLALAADLFVAPALQRAGRGDILGVVAPRGA